MQFNSLEDFTFVLVLLILLSVHSNLQSQTKGELPVKVLNLGQQQKNHTREDAFTCVVLGYIHTAKK